MRPPDAPPPPGGEGAGERNTDVLDRQTQTSGTDCIDCGFNTLSTAWGQRAEWYHVYPDLWVEAGMKPHGGCLCIGCLEARLGRMVLPTDFTDAPINDPWRADYPRYAWTYRTRRLTDRLRGTSYWRSQQGMLW